MENVIEKFLKKINFSALFSRSQSGALGIDIGTCAVKVIQLEKKKGKIYLKKYGSLAFGPYGQKSIGESVKLPNQKIGLAIGTLFNELFPKEKNVKRKGIISIPLKSSLVTVIDIPKVEDSQMENAVTFEARKYIPFPPNEVTINWIKISEDEEEEENKSITNGKQAGAEGTVEDKKASAVKMVRVMVVAIHNNTIGSYQEIAGLIGINTFSFEVETFSIIRAVGEKERKSYVICDVGCDSTKIAVVHNSKIVASHTINVGSQNLTTAVVNSFGVSFAEAEEVKRRSGFSGMIKGKKIQDVLVPVLEGLFSQVKKIIDEYEKLERIKVELIYLVGGGAMLGGIEQIAQKITGRSMSFGEPFKSIEPPAEILRPILKDGSPEFAVAVGLALRALEEL